MLNDTILEMIDDELSLARHNFSNFKNYHEGYAVIKEEFDELWMEIKRVKHFDTDHYKENIKTEAVQLAAMAIRFIEDLCE